MSFSHIGLIEGSSQELFDEYKETLDSLDKTSDELKTAQDSYQELYNAQKKWIELSNGGDIEEQARRYKTMTDEQKHQFDEALKKLAELNLEMNMLPLEKRINIDVVKRTAGIAVPSTVPTMGKSVAMPYADGGLINKPHVGLVGEAGPEAIIPLSGSRRKRALGLYQTVGRALGVREYANGGMVNMASATRSPVINSSGGHSTQPIMIENKPTVVVKGDASEGTIKLIEQAMQRVNDDFGRKLEAYLRQKGRVSMSGV
jgi:hypothetical protein